jgi:hypothetical protein
MMNWKGYGRKRSWPDWRYYPGICLERLRKTTKNLSQDIPSMGRDLNAGPPEYEVGVLTNRPRLSVHGSFVVLRQNLKPPAYTSVKTPVHLRFTGASVQNVILDSHNSLVRSSQKITDFWQNSSLFDMTTWVNCILLVFAYRRKLNMRAVSRCCQGLQATALSLLSGRIIRMCCFTIDFHLSFTCILTPLIFSVGLGLRGF